MSLYRITDNRVAMPEWPWGAGKLNYKRLGWLPVPFRKQRYLLQRDISLSCCSSIIAVKKANGKMSTIINEGESYRGYSVINGEVTENDAFMDPIKDWKGIEKVYCYTYTIFGIKRDGTIAVAGTTDFDNSITGTANWTNLNKVAFTGDRYRTVGLRKDGTCYFAGDTEDGDQEIKVRSWTDIVDVIPRYQFFVAVKSDGTCVCSYSKDDRQAPEECKNWTDIVRPLSLSCAWCFAGLKSDGTIVIAEDDGHDHSDDAVLDWKHLIDFSEPGFGITANGDLIHADTDFDTSVFKNENLIYVHAEDNYLLGVTNDFRIIVTPHPDADESWFMDANNLNLFDGRIERTPLVAVPVHVVQSNVEAKLEVPLDNVGGIGLGPAAFYADLSGDIGESGVKAIDPAALNADLNGDIGESGVKAIAPAAIKSGITQNVRSSGTKGLNASLGTTIQAATAFSGATGMQATLTY